MKPPPGDEFWTFAAWLAGRSLAILLGLTAAVAVLYVAGSPLIVRDHASVAMGVLAACAVGMGGLWYVAAARRDGK